MMEEQQLNPLAVTHLLQHTLRSLCIQENSQWTYAVFWRILPRNYPPPKWDLQGGVYDGTRGNRRNWILVWEDGFCNFNASSSFEQVAPPVESASASYRVDCNEIGCMKAGLQPEIFFKMSHEIYNYGEGLIGKVAADHSHKWVFREPPHDQEINFLPSWNNPADSQPRTWEAQFQSGIKTIALIAVREGVVQLGSINKITEDLSYVVLLRKKFAYLESIPGVLLPHPSSAAVPIIGNNDGIPQGNWTSMQMTGPAMAPQEMYDQFLIQQNQAMRVPPSMTSLEALLSKLPAVGPREPINLSSAGYYEMPSAATVEGETRPSVAAKEEVEEEFGSGSMSSSYYVDNMSKSGQDF